MFCIKTYFILYDIISFLIFNFHIFYFFILQSAVIVLSFHRCIVPTVNIMINIVNKTQYAVHWESIPKPKNAKEYLLLNKINSNWIIHILRFKIKKGWMQHNISEVCFILLLFLFRDSVILGTYYTCVKIKFCCFSSTSKSNFIWDLLY